MEIVAYWFECKLNIVFNVMDYIGGMLSGRGSNTSYYNLFGFYCFYFQQE